MAGAIHFHSRVLSLMRNPSWEEGIAIWEEEVPKFQAQSSEHKRLFEKSVVQGQISSVFPFLIDIFKKATSSDKKDWKAIVSESRQAVKQTNWSKISVVHWEPTPAVRQALEILRTLQNLHVLKERAISSLDDQQKIETLIDILKTPQFEEYFAQHKVIVLQEIANTLPEPVKEVLLKYCGEGELLVSFREIMRQTLSRKQVKVLALNPKITEAIDTLNGLIPLMALRSQALAEGDDRNKFEKLVQIMELPPNKGLFIQYKATVIREIAKTISEESPIRIELNKMMAQVFSLDLEKNPQEGFERFTMDPLDETNRAIFILVVNKLMFLEKRNLTEVPPWIKHASSCETLGFPNNQLTGIPAWIGGLPSVISLFFERNQIETVPPELGRLSSLKALILRGNNLREVPPELGNLTNLFRFVLAENQLETLPPEYCRLKNFPLMKGNPLIYLPSQLIPKAPGAYKDFAFNLTSDLTGLESVLSGRLTFEDLPIRLQVLIKKSIYVYFQRYYPEDIDLSDPDFGGTTFRKNPNDPKVQKAISWVLEKLKDLKTLRDEVIARESDQDKLRGILQMQFFPEDKVLFQQQIAEAIIDVSASISSSLQIMIEAAVGFEKFTLRPCEDEVRKAILSLAQTRQTEGLEKSFYQALSSRSPKDILPLYEYENESADRMITFAIEALPLERKEAIKLQIFQRTSGEKNGDDAVNSHPRSEVLKQALQIL